MGKVDVAWNTFLDTLNSELKEIEERTFKRNDWASVAAARDKMIGVMRSPESRRYERGLAVRDYRNQYRRNGGELAWRDDDGAGAKIARIEENTTAKSADHWIKDAEFAEPLGDLLRDAMLACNCDPTLRKNKDIVNALMEQDGPKNLEEARKLVEKVIAEKSSRKRAQPVSASERRERLANRVTDFIINQPTRTWDVTREEIFELVKAKVETEEERRKAVVEREPRAIARRADAIGLNRPVLVTAPRIVGPKSTAAARPASPARNKSSRPQVKRKYSHPWGNASLDVLEVLTPDSGGNQRVQFHRKSLYEVGMDLRPTRYLVAGKLDLFDPGVADEVFDEHLNVFLKADWHTFVALTPHADSIRRHWQRWKVAPRNGFPINFWPGVKVDCVDHLSRIRTLRETGMRTKWASFVDYHSGGARTLYTSIFPGTELVVFGWDFANPQSPLSPEDALILAKAATKPDSRFFFSHPKSRQAFLTGTPPVSELPAAKNPPVNNEDLKKLFENAQSSQYLPQEWFEHPFSGRKGAFQEFTGEEVKLFYYQADTRTDPIGAAEAS
jgi:protein gp37